jgi:glycosyltransferase involved in cell wall biosynthesis
MSEELVYWPRSRRGDADRVVVATVSYNTRDLIALFVWSVHRLLGNRIHGLIVVDNGSTDGSRELLESWSQAGLCKLIANDTNRYHGPALNQAMSCLAARASRADEPAGWAWLLDSDCIVRRPDALDDAVHASATHDAALLGERKWDPWHRCERLALHSLFIDPARVWQPAVHPFVDDGDPSYELERSCVTAGLGALAFPFVSQGYVIHRGRDTLASVYTRGDDSNRLYQWASTHQEPHFELIAQAADTYAALVEQFKDEVPKLHAEHLVRACQLEA